MTKDEFLSMLSSELENLENDYRTAIQRVDYFRQVNSSSKELQDAKYQLKMIQQKINVLRRLIALPSYLRIQAMSDAEIDEYKKGKVEELELKIKEIESRVAQENEKLSQLKAEQDQLIAQFGILSGSERDRAIYRGQQLSSEIRRYDSDNPFSTFAQLKKEIEELRKQQEQIKTMTSQEIKQQLSSEIKGSRDLAQTVELTKTPIDEFTELEASVAYDPEKAQQMARLLAHYRELSDEQSQIKGRMQLVYGLPRTLVSRLTGGSYRYYYDIRTNELRDPDKLMEIVKEFEVTFKQAKASFMEQFTEHKLSKLVGREYGIDSTEVDMNFLQQHSDKLGDGELSHLQSLVEQRNKLLKKIFKTRDTKLEIESLNNRIRQEQSKIYKEIIGWYQSQSSDILGISYGVQFYSLEALKSSLERCKEDIGRSEQAITEVKEKIQQAKVEMEQQRQNYETRRNEVARQIRALGGEKHKETDISYASNQSGYNLDQIANASNRIYQGKIVNRVEQEAQKQADIKEAELRGITIEQLLKMRKTARAILDESMANTGAEEVSHGGMKM